MSLTDKKELLKTLKGCRFEIEELEIELREEKIVCDTYREIVASVLNTTINRASRGRLTSAAVNYDLNSTIRQLDMDLMEGKK